MNLIEKNIVLKIAKEFRSSLSWEDMEDCESSAYLKALKYWKKERGMAFNSFCHLLLHQECLDMVKRKKRISLVCNIPDRLGSYHPQISECFSFLSDFHKGLLIDRFFGNMTYDEIGAKYGYSRQWAYEHVDKAIQIAKLFVEGRK